MVSSIKIYQTHIEVSPYKKGDNKDLEASMSYWDNVMHKYIPMTYYIEDDILYLPRGTNPRILETAFRVKPQVGYGHDPFDRIEFGEGLFEPKSKIQENAINFLCSTGDFCHTSRYAQLGLNLGTGEGKTYSAIYSILALKIKGLIITHQEKIKQHWIDTLVKKTSIPIDRIVNISGSNEISKINKGELEGDIYLVNHQTLQGYAKTHGWKRIRVMFQTAKIGIKVIDESHKYFENTFMIDNFSNCYKTFYLTATFGRSDYKEEKLYHKAFSNLIRFDDSKIEKRKHTRFIVCYFRSIPQGKQPSVRTIHGFSNYKYIDYELNFSKRYKSNEAILKGIEKILTETSHLKGKTLILSPKKESVDLIADKVYEITGHHASKIYSNNTSDENEEAKNSRYISSTSKSTGEGTDIKGLRVLILVEPIGNPLLINQIQGRLREYSDTEDTYFFYLVDTTIKESYNTVKAIMPVMKKKCKDIIYTKFK